MRPSGIKQLHHIFLKSTGICTDTRKEVEGSLFFALKGENFDGNRFVEDAVAKGCMLALTERKELDGDPGILYVADALKALQELAHFHRKQVNPQVLAITGSNGKTTTKELMKEVLGKKFSVLATKGNLNNHIGVPLTLLSLKQEEIAVVEMGANHPGEIAELARIAAPGLGLITNVGKAHLEGFGSLEGVLKAKGELYEYLAFHKGRALVDGSDHMLMEKAESAGVETLVVGAEGDLPLSANLVSQNPFLELELTLAGSKHSVSTGLVGSYNLQNIRLAAGVGLQFGVPAASIAEAIAAYVPENQRSQLVKGEHNQVILDSYNANPDSMREAIGGFLNFASGPRMLLLGDMAELGDASEEEHRELVQWIETLDMDRVMLVGPKFTRACEPSSRLLVFSDRQELEARLKAEKPYGYHILVKGSRVMELERLRPLLY
ncbi:MAG: UDP-N-acetylmuramoyl-tripeptide--D-alanyl-D-alanine ligase [Bacteroidota bacterium]